MNSPNNSTDGTPYPFVVIGESILGFITIMALAVIGLTGVIFYLSLWISSVMDNKVPALLHVHLSLAEYGLLIAYLAVAHDLCSPIIFGLLCTGFGVPLVSFLIARRHRWLVIFREINSFWWSNELSRGITQVNHYLALGWSTFALPNNRVECTWLLCYVLRVGCNIVASLILRPVILLVIHVVIHGFCPLLENIMYLLYIFISIVGCQARVFSNQNLTIRSLEEWRVIKVDPPDEILYCLNLSVWVHLFCFTIPVFAIVLINHIVAFGTPPSASDSPVRFNLSIALLVITAISLVLNGYAFIGFLCHGNRRWSEYDRFNLSFSPQSLRLGASARGRIVHASTATYNPLEGIVNRTTVADGETQMVHIQGSASSATSSNSQRSSASSTPVEKLDESINSEDTAGSEDIEQGRLDDLEPSSRPATSSSHQEVPCTICTTNQFRKQALNCGHIMCAACVAKIKVEANRCPFCNTQISFTLNLFNA